MAGSLSDSTYRMIRRTPRDGQVGETGGGHGLARARGPGRRGRPRRRTPRRARGSAAWSSGRRAGRHRRRPPAAPPGSNHGSAIRSARFAASIDPCSGWWAKAAAFTRTTSSGVGVAVAADGHPVDLGHVDGRASRVHHPQRAHLAEAEVARPVRPRPDGRRATTPSARLGPPPGPPRPAPARRRGLARRGATATSRSCPRSSAKPSSVSHTALPSSPRWRERHPGGLVDRVDAVDRGGVGVTRSTRLRACSSPSACDAHDAQDRLFSGLDADRLEPAPWPGARTGSRRCGPSRSASRAPGPSLARRRRTWTSTVRVPPK